MGDFHLGGYKVSCVKCAPGYLAIFVERTTLVYTEEDWELRLRYV